MNLFFVEPVDPVRVARDGNCFIRTMSFILLGIGMESKMKT